MEDVVKEEQRLSKHELKELKRHEKDGKKESSSEKQKRKKLTKNVIILGVVAIILLGIIFLFYRAISSSKDFKPYYSGAYHWHANLEVSACGTPVPIECGTSMCGPMNLHHHNDNIIHMEGNTIAKQSDLALGNFFDGIRIPFSSTEIMDKKNGDLCPDGKSGEVSMYVNGQPNNEFRNFIPKPCDSKNIAEDCDKIEIKFE